MATSTPSGDVAPSTVLDSIATPGGIQTLLNIFKGTPGSTTTSSNQVSLATQQALLQKELISGTSGIQGLAAISQGQKSAGMYNSTVNAMLTNQLLAQSASDVAALSSTHTSTTAGIPQASASKTIGTALGSALIGNLVGKGVSAVTGGTATDAILGMLGLGTTALSSKGIADLMSSNQEAVTNAGTAGKEQGMEDIANNVNPTMAANAEEGQAVADALQNKRLKDMGDITDTSGGAGNIASGASYPVSQADANTPVMAMNTTSAQDTTAVTNAINASMSDLVQSNINSDTGSSSSVSSGSSAGATGNIDVSGLLNTTANSSAAGTNLASATVTPVTYGSNFTGLAGLVDGDPSTYSPNYVPGVTTLLGTPIYGAGGSALGTPGKGVTSTIYNQPTTNSTYQYNPYDPNNYGGGAGRNTPSSTTTNVSITPGAGTTTPTEDPGFSATITPAGG